MFCTIKAHSQPEKSKVNHVTGVKFASVGRICAGLSHYLVLRSPALPEALFGRRPSSLVLETCVGVCVGGCLKKAEQNNGTLDPAAQVNQSTSVQIIQSVKILWSCPDL